MTITSTRNRTMALHVLNRGESITSAMIAKLSEAGYTVVQSAPQNKLQTHFVAPKKHNRAQWKNEQSHRGK